MDQQEATDRRRQRDHDHEQELSQLHQRMTQEAADATEMERVQRHEALDEVNTTCAHQSYTIVVGCCFDRSFWEQSVPLTATAWCRFDGRSCFW